MSRLTFNGTSPKEAYDNLFTLEVGQVFKIESDYETVMRRIDEYSDGKFEVYPITPGTDLYTMYGPDHCIVTDKRLSMGDLEPSKL